MHVRIRPCLPDRPAFARRRHVPCQAAQGHHEWAHSLAPGRWTRRVTAIGPSLSRRECTAPAAALTAGGQPRNVPARHSDHLKAHPRARSGQCSCGEHLAVRSRPPSQVRLVVMAHAEGESDEEWAASTQQLRHLKVCSTCDARTRLLMLPWHPLQQRSVGVPRCCC